MKHIYKYTLIFIITIFILMAILTLVAKIPRKYIEQSCQESIEHYDTYSTVEQVLKRRDYTFIHNEADANILSIIYSLDTDNPFSSVLEAKFYMEDFFTSK